MSKVTITLKAGIGFEDLVATDDNVMTLKVDSDSTLQSVVERVGLGPDDRFLTSLNNNIVVKSDRGTCLIKEGDVVEILPPLTGG